MLCNLRCSVTHREGSPGLFWALRGRERAALKGPSGGLLLPAVWFRGVVVDPSRQAPGQVSVWLLPLSCLRAVGKAHTACLMSECVVSRDLQRAHRQAYSGDFTLLTVSGTANAILLNTTTGIAAPLQCLVATCCCCWWPCRCCPIRGTAGQLDCPYRLMKMAQALLVRPLATCVPLRVRGNCLCVWFSCWLPEGSGLAAHSAIVVAAAHVCSGSTGAYSRCAPGQQQHVHAMAWDSS